MYNIEAGKERGDTYALHKKSNGQHLLGRRKRQKTCLI